MDVIYIRKGENDAKKLVDLGLALTQDSGACKIVCICYKFDPSESISGKLANVDVKLGTSEEKAQVVVLFQDGVLSHKMGAEDYARGLASALGKVNAVPACVVDLTFDEESRGWIERVNKVLSESTVASEGTAGIFDMLRRKSAQGKEAERLQVENEEVNRQIETKLLAALRSKGKNFWVPRDDSADFIAFWNLMKNYNRGLSLYVHFRKHWDNPLITSLTPSFLFPHSNDASIFFAKEVLVTSEKIEVRIVKNWGIAWSTEECDRHLKDDTKPDERESWHIRRYISDFMDSNGISGRKLVLVYHEPSKEDYLWEQVREDFRKDAECMAGRNFRLGTPWDVAYKLGRKIVIEEPLESNQ